jgi:alpha-tubulin suppressor-like RCC1 family protein
MTIYRDKKTKERIEASNSFAGTTGMQVELDGLESLALERALKPIAKRLMDRKNVAGIHFTSLGFQYVLDSDGEVWKDR